MHAGELLEIGDSSTLFDNPQHDYTRRLLAAIPADSPRQRRQRDINAFGGRSAVPAPRQLPVQS